MPTPSQQQARSQHATQAAMAAAAAAQLGGMIAASQPWATVLATLAQYQLAAAMQAIATIAGWADRPALIQPRAFVGVSSAGFPIVEPVIAAIDRIAPAPAMALPAPWWSDGQAAAAAAMRVIEGQIRDAARAAMQAEIVAEPEWQNFVRVLVPPSCKRCVVLAGRIYRDLDEFSRHPPTCDCLMVPVQDWDEAVAKGLITDPMEAFEQGHIRDLTKAERQAITDGADITKVINASRGMYAADLMGRRVKATREGTTARAAWRRRNPTRLIRLTPGAIYRIVNDEYGGDRDEARRLLEIYGYLT